MLDGKPTCVIADDHEVVLRGLAGEIESFTNVTGTASTGDDAIELVLSQRPDLLFLDIRMPGPGVDGVIKELRSGGSDTRVIVFSSLTAVVRGVRVDGAPCAHLRGVQPLTPQQRADLTTPAARIELGNNPHLVRRRKPTTTPLGRNLRIRNITHPASVTRRRRGGL